MSNQNYIDENLIIAFPLLNKILNKYITKEIFQKHKQKYNNGLLLFNYTLNKYIQDVLINNNGRLTEKDIKNFKKNSLLLFTLPKTKNIDSYEELQSIIQNPELKSLQTQLSNHISMGFPGDKKDRDRKFKKITSVKTRIEQMKEQLLDIKKRREQDLKSKRKRDNSEERKHSPKKETALEKYNRMLKKPINISPPKPRRTIQLTQEYFNLPENQRENYLQNIQEKNRQEYENKKRTLILKARDLLDRNKTRMFENRQSEIDDLINSLEQLKVEKPPNTNNLEIDMLLQQLKL